MTADEWNARYLIGTPVVAYPLTRPEDGIPSYFEQLVSRTRTPAWTLGHGEPVVSVVGYAGGICLTHVDVITEAVMARIAQRHDLEDPRVEAAFARLAIDHPDAVLASLSRPEVAQ